MSLDKLNAALVADVAALKEEGRAKAPERVIVGYVPASGVAGTALPAAWQRPRLPADEQQQLPVAVEPSRGAGRGRRGVARVWRRPGRRALHRRHVRAACQLEARIARFVDRPAARVVQLRLHDRPRPRDHARRARHLLDRRRAQPQLHHPRDADRERARRRSARSTSTTTSPISRTTSSACPTARAASSSSSTASSACAATTLRSMRSRRSSREHEHRFRDGVVTVMDDSHGIAAYGANRARHRGALRRARRHLRRHVRQGVRRQRRVRRGQRRARRSRAAEGRYLHLHQPARARRTRPPR